MGGSHVQGLILPVSNSMQFYNRLMKLRLQLV